MKKQNLFAEIIEGFDALAESRDGEQKLRIHELDIHPSPDMTPQELPALRERLNLLRRMFARYLRINSLTLENGSRAGPNLMPRLHCWFV